MSYAEFWGAIVEQAALDILRPEIVQPSKEERQNAIEWVENDSRGIASYVWACEMAGVDPDIVRQAMRARKITSKGET